jgi:beta-propeller repeat-containing protein
MWKKIAAPALFMILSALDSPAQSAYCWNWTKAAGGRNDDGGTLIALYQNYIYNSGVFTSPTITFDDSVYFNRGRKDIFLTKHDTKGDIIWSKTIGGQWNETPAGMAVDSRGDVYIGGTFSGLLYCDNVALPGAGGTDIFIAMGQGYWIGH